MVELVIIAFILVTENLGSRMYPAEGAPWRRLVVPVLGSLITGILLERYFRDARGSGIPQTKAALLIHEGHTSSRTVPGKFGCSSVSLASGIALGREGPSVHVGAGIASVLGRLLGLSSDRVKALVPVGASAALAVLLSYFFRAERRERAEAHFQSGNQLVEQGRVEEAIERFRNALSMSHSREHRLALALALVRSERLNEAAIYLRELAQDEPNSGVLNLGLARVASGQGRTHEAVNYYHRAMYGDWPQDPEQNRVQVRLELIGVLAGSGANRQAVTELLALAEQAPGDTATRKRVARSLLELGAAQQSSEVLREVIRRQPRDAEAYAGLGEAEFARGNFSSAQRALQEALRWNPNDEAARRRLQVCDQIEELDPTWRGLRPSERYRRSRNLLEGALGAWDACAASRQETPVADSVRELADSARKVLSHRGRPSSYAEATEGNIALAQRLWDSRKELCGPASERDDALARTLARLSQQQP